MELLKLFAIWLIGFSSGLLGGWYIHGIIVYKRIKKMVESGEIKQEEDY